MWLYRSALLFFLTSFYQLIASPNYVILSISVSVNCAHLHPQYGEQTPEQELQALQEEEEDLDLNLRDYKERRMLARRSPYPSVVVEVRATPPPEFTPPAPTGPVTPKVLDDCLLYTSPSPRD